MPESGQTSASKPHRAGVAERFAAPAGPKTIAGDLALITSEDARLRDLERSRLQTAQPHEAHPRSLLQTVPGSGTSLRLGRLYAIQDMDRVPRGQDCASYGRLVHWAKASDGKRVGPSGKHIGNAPLPWALSEAAGLCLRHNEPGQQRVARLEQQHATGKALRIRAPH